MSSKLLHQMELLSAKPQPHVEEISISMIRRRPTFLRAWHLAQEISGLEDKKICDMLKIDGSHWTKMKKGRASPPADARFTQYMDVVQNEVPLIWLAEARGYDWTTIRKHRSDVERKNADLEKDNADLRAELKRVVGYLMDALRRR
jgi:hypothetical protein